MRHLVKLGMLGMLFSTAVLADTIPNTYVAEAIQSLIEAEKQTYSSLVVERTDDHGCVVAMDEAAFKADKSTVPTVEDFQGITARDVKSRDGGKYAKALNIKKLAATPGAMDAREASDLLHAYADSSRTNYTLSVIARAKNSGCGEPMEEWVEEDGLALPAQFTRATAKAVQDSGKFLYTLKSDWPINQQNKPSTDFEKKALKAVQMRKPQYGTETLAEQRYFSAAYADIATSKACVSCHNDHLDSPKTDFKLDDVMGGMVIRIPVN